MPDGSTLNGYALDDGRIDRNKVPAGWHAYSVMESDGDEDGETTLSIDHDGYVNHRMDFITTEDLSQRIDSGQLTEIHGDDWGSPTTTSWTISPKNPGMTTSTSTLNWRRNATT